MISYEKIFGTLPQGIAYCKVKNTECIDLKGIDIVEYNRAFALCFSLPEIQEESLTYIDFSHVSLAGKEKFQEAAKAVLKTKKIQQFLHYSQSQESQFETIFTPIDEESFLVTVNDVSIQFLNAAEKDIILSSLNNIIFVFDEEFRYLNIFVADENTLFLPIEEVIGHTINEMFPSAFSTKVMESFKQAKETNQTVTIVLESPMPFDDRIFTYQQQYIMINNQSRYVSTVVDVTEDVKLKNELKIQTEQLEKFFTVNLDLLCILDSEGFFVRINKIWEEVLGHTLEELKTKSVFDLIHPDDIEATQKRMDMLNNSQEIANFVNRYRRKDGTYRFFEWRTTSAGDLIYAAARDITEQKNIEQELRYQKEQFEMAIEGSQEGIFDWDIANNSLYLSKRWKKMLGYEDYELENIFDTFSDLVVEEDIGFVMKKITRYFDGIDKTYDIEFRMKHKEGHLVWVNARAEGLRDQDGIVVRMAGSHSDITKRKKDSRQLEEAYTRLNQMAEFGRIITWEIDVEGRYVYVSPMFKKIFGFEPEDVIGKYFHEFHPEKGREEFRLQAMKEISTGQKIVNFENPMVTKDNDVIWVMTNGIPNYASNGTLLSYRGSDQDITVIKESQKALQESEEKYRLLTENLSDVLWIYTLKKDEFTYFSSSIKNLTGYDREELYEKGIQEIMNEESYVRLYDMIQQSLVSFKHNPTNQTPHLCDIQVLKKNGLTNWVELSFSYRYNEQQEVEVIGVGRDIEDRKRIESELHHLSFHDTLTNLYNRAYYEEELKRLNVPRNLPLSIIMADINDLKLTNDTFGHLEGDKLIKTFANVLKEATREDDILARIGGDEFVVLLPQTNEEEVQQIVDRIDVYIEKEAPTKLKLSAAIGNMTTHELFDNLDEVFKKAEDAMYKHKLRNKLTQEAETLEIIEKSFKQRYTHYYELCHTMTPYVLNIAKRQDFTKEELMKLENASKFALVGLLSDEDISLKHNAYRIAQHGYHILKNVPSFRDVADIVLALFENVDGSGQPHQLIAKEIPVASKILRIALDYCQYKNQNLNHQDSVKLLTKQVDIMYDKEIFELAMIAIKGMHDEKI